MNNDLISREALKEAINIERNAVCDVLDIIDNIITRVFVHEYTRKAVRNERKEV